VSIWGKIRRILRIRGYGISILVPFNSTEPNRVRNWHWIKRYIRCTLPGCQIVMGKDPQPELAFSKSSAVNDAASQADGDIYVILDADVFLSAKSILHCAREIRHARSKGWKLWFVPYRRMYRLTKETSDRMLNSWRPRFSPDKGTFANSGMFLGSPASRVGHWFGAMCQIVPAKGFVRWDERFRGWGGEDGAAMFATDTLYAPHKTLPGQVLHLWHPVQTGPPSIKGYRQRLWTGQTSARDNDALNDLYFKARGNRKLMLALIEASPSLWKTGAPQSEDSPSSSNIHTIPSPEMQAGASSLA
jgi:hypothetical protein